MSVSSYSTTPADNTSINGLPVTDSTVVNVLDDIIRQLMADVKAADDANLKTSGDVTVTGSWTFTGNLNIASANITGNAVGDGTYGEIVVSGSSWTIGNSAVDTLALADGAVTVAKINATTLVTESEGLASQDDDNSIPTVAAVIDYVDATQSSVIDLTNGGANDLSTATFSSIPSGINEIDLLYLSVSLADSTNVLVQLSTGGSFATTGYAGGSGNETSTLSSSQGFPLRLSSEPVEKSGLMSLRRLPGTNSWVTMHAANDMAGGGGVTLGGALDGIRLISSTSTFDSGSVAIRYRK